MNARAKNSDVDEKQIITTVAALREIDGQIAELRDERKIILRDAKTLGLNTKTIAKVMARKKLERADVLAQDEALREYELALGLSVLM